MDYVRKLCILKQLAQGFASDGRTVSALLVAEKFGGRLSLALSLIGFAPVTQGRYRLLVCDEKGETQVFDVPSPAGGNFKRECAFDLSGGFCAIVCHVDGSAKPAAFGKCGEKTYDVKRLCATLDEAEKKQERIVYDDEIVATENYYEFERTAPPAPAAEEAEEKDEKDAEKERETCPQDEDAQGVRGGTDTADVREDARTRYYDQVKGELDALFEAHPAEEELQKRIPLSRWAKVTFSRNKYYTVGVISDETGARYICYGVPAEKRDAPPPALSGLCSFLPLSVFEPDGRGYWMMYQDAVTGKSIRR